METTTETYYRASIIWDKGRLGFSYSPNHEELADAMSDAENLVGREFKSPAEIVVQKVQVVRTVEVVERIACVD